MKRVGRCFFYACWWFSRAGFVESLDDDVEIVVPEDDHGLFAIDILDPSWVSELLGVTSLNGVEKQILSFANGALVMGVSFCPFSLSMARGSNFGVILVSCDTVCLLIEENGRRGNGLSLDRGTSDGYWCRVKNLFVL